MFVANNENGEKISIENANKIEKYICPICKRPVIFKKGKVRVSHFAHKIDSNCVDWGDMSEWHLGWQRKFPIDCREVVIEKNGIIHRADVLVGNTVIEFQHSQISNKDFNDRCFFYIENGYNLIWVFDGNKKIKKPEDYKAGLIKTLCCLNDYIEQELEWKRYKKDEELLRTEYKIMVFYEVFIESMNKSILLPLKRYNSFSLYIKWLYDYITVDNFLKSYSPDHANDDVISINDIYAETDEFLKKYEIPWKITCQELKRFMSPTYRYYSRRKFRF